MLISVILIVSRILLVECAPKIGHVLFDPLLYEAHKDNTEVVSTTVDDATSDDDFLVNEPENITENSKVLPDTALREDNEKALSEANPSTVIKESEDVILKNAVRTADTVPKYGYEFDQTLCKEINEVIMCGYDKNQGDVKNNAAPVALQNREGCVIRHDRIECGYVKGNYIQGARLLRSKFLTSLNLNTSDSLNTSEQIEMAVKNPFNSFSIFKTTFGSTFPVNSAPVSYKESTDPVSNSQTTNSTNTQPEDTTTTKVTSNSYPESTHTVTYAEKSDVDQLLLSQAYPGLLMLLSALSSGKITPWLTSRVGRDTSTRQIPTRTTTATTEIITEAASASITEIATSPILETTTSPSNLPDEAMPEEDKDALRTKQAIVEDIEDEPYGSTGGCVSCVWKSMMKKPGLRNLDEITTEKCATRCVEIGDRIVCYPFKFKSTSPITP